MPYSASCSAFSHGLEMEKSKEKQVLTMSARYASDFHEASVRAGADAKKLNQILDMGDDPFGNPTQRADIVRSCFSFLFSIIRSRQSVEFDALYGI